MPSQVRSIHPFTQPLNLTDTLSVTFHNAINIYNHRRHPTQRTNYSRIPHPAQLCLISSLLLLGISWTSLNVSYFFLLSISLTLTHSLTVFYVVCFHSRMNAWPTMIHMATASSIPRRTAAASALPSRCFRFCGPIRILHRKRSYWCQTRRTWPGVDLLRPKVNTKRGMWTGRGWAEAAD